MPKILLLDNYDSFTYNLWDYLMRQQAEIEVLVWRNDEYSLAQIQAENFDAILLSPGPKRPSDAGLLLEIIAEFYNKIPILGVCLGHQALGEFFGASLVLADLPMHGKTSNIRHFGSDLFAGIPTESEVMRYHSLILKNIPTDVLEIIAETENGDCMAIRHRRLPLWGVQFHPESILTAFGLKIIENWVKTLKTS